MNYSNIETFLTIAETRSLTKAAEILYLSQSTISYRLKSLEQELGHKLIQREQGKGFITLTAKGEEFINIAQTWKSLLKETEIWKTNNSLYKLNVGSVDSLNTCIFSQFYKNILKGDPQLLLNVSSHWTVTIHKFIENYEADIGFVLWQIPSNNINSKPLFSERMVLISSFDSYYSKDIHPNDLDNKNEIFLYSGPNYKVWHDYWWDKTIKEYLTVDTVSLLRTFFNFSNCWSIVPISIAKIIQQNNLIKISEITNPPPERVCYQITNKHPIPRNKEPLETFNGYLDDFLKSDFFRCLID